MTEPLDRRPRVLVVYGTRPEAVKLAPVLEQLRDPGDVEVIVAVTGQHRELLDQVNDAFGIVPDHDLRLLTHGQTPAGLLERALPGLTGVIRETSPDLVLVQGDTTTTFAAGLAAFYERVRVVHLEAGLRTGDLDHPFPEEANRRLTATLTTLHLAPTSLSRANLLAEGVAADRVVVTGNTVIDALYRTLDRPVHWTNPRLQVLVGSDTPIVTVTMHRREAWGRPMAQVADAVATIARRRPDVSFVLPAHPNPVVRDVLEPRLGALPNVLLVEPMAYPEFCHLMAASRLLITDSGGLQEEGPSLARPVLVTRTTTERPEGLVSGLVRLVGFDHDTIVAAAESVLSAPTAPEAVRRGSPYGDGHAAERAAAAIRAQLGLGSRLPDFGSRADATAIR